MLGLSISTAAFFDSRAAALPILLLIGAIGGLLVVPMNSLLQHRGQMLLTAGRSMTVQNFNENFSILVMLATYAGLLWLGLAIVPRMVVPGLATAALVGLLIWRERGLPKRKVPAQSLRVFRSCPLITPKDARSSLQMLAIARAMAALCARAGRPWPSPGTNSPQDCLCPGSA